MPDRSVRVVLDATVTGFVGKMGAASQSAIGFARTANAAIESNSTAMNQLAGTAFKVGAGLTAVAGFAVKAAMDWESSWAGVTKTVSGTRPQLAALEQDLRNLATSMPESHQEIAAVAEAAGQLGIKRQDVAAFTKTMIMLGDTTNLTSEEAATSIAQMANIMGTSAHDIDNLGAALVQLGNNGASTERQIIEMAQRIAGAGRIVGLSEQNVLGLASAVASTGIEVEAGGTAISQALIKATTAVETNSGELQVWARTAGMSAQEFAQAWRDDPAAAFLAFEQGLNKQGTKAFATLEQLGLDGARVGRVLVNLAGANDLLRASFADADAAWRQNTALVNEAEKRYDTTAAKAKIAWNQIKDAGIDAGNGLLPVVAGIAEGVGGVSEAFRALPGPVKGGITALAAIGGVSLLALAGLIKLTQAAKNMGLAMGVLSEAQAGNIGAGLGKAGRAAGLAAIPVAALSLAFKAISDRPPATVKEWTAALLDLRTGGKAAQQTLDGLAQVSLGPDTFQSMFKQLAAPGWIKASNAIESFITLGQVDVFRGSRESIAAMDSALAGLVEGGKIEDAAAGFDRLSIEAAKQDISFQELREMLPAYTAALKAAGAESGKTADAFTSAAGGSDMLGRRLQELGTDPDKAVEALHKLQQEARTSARGFAGFSKGLDDMGGSLDSWKRKLEENLKAQRDFNKNIITLGLRGVPDEWLGDLMKQGPEQVGTLVAALAKSTDKELANLVGLWQDAGSEIADVWQALPQDVRIAISTVGDRDSQDKLAKLLATTTDLSTQDIKLLLQANPDLAASDIKYIMGLVEDYRTSNPTTMLDADPSPAEATALALVQWMGTLTGVMPIDGDPAPGEGSADSLNEYILNQQPQMPIDGNNKPGKKETKNLEGYVKSRKPKMPVGADTSSARRAISAFFNAWNGKVIHLLPFVGKGGAMGMRIPPGFAAGGKVPGTPPADPRVDNVRAMGASTGQPLAVRSGEWIVNQAASERNDPWLRAVNAGLNLDDVFGVKQRKSILGFAAGGAWDAAWKSSAGTVQAGGTPSGADRGQELTVDLAGLEIGFDSDGVARIARGEIRATLAEVGRKNQQNFQRSVRSG